MIAAIRVLSTSAVVDLVLANLGSSHGDARFWKEIYPGLSVGVTTLD